MTGVLDDYLVDPEVSLLDKTRMRAQVLRAMRLGNPRLQRPSRSQTQPQCPDRQRGGGCAPGVPPGAAPDGCIDRARSSSVRVESTHDFMESCGSQRTATIASPLRKKKAAPPLRSPSRA